MKFPIRPHFNRKPITANLSTILSRSIATHTYNHHATQLSVLPSKVDTSSKDYKENAAQFNDVMAQMRELHARIEKGGPEKAREKHVARGKMLPREYAQTVETYGIND